MPPQKEIVITTPAQEKNYPVFISRGCLGRLPRYLKTQHHGKKMVCIIDSVVAQHYKNTVTEILRSRAQLLLTVPSGEHSKSRKEKERIEDSMLANKFGRDTVIVAVGGGVIGDLAGFVAATYNRGIPIIHVPTTLLSMVDSSIGGKTGINTAYGKNLIGATHQPDAVFDDLLFLDTLPAEEFSSGMAEVIKMAITSDRNFFDFLSRNCEKILQKNEQQLLEVISKSVVLKKNIVEKDPNEKGMRQILNFGHTAGHALEQYFLYAIRHGFCIALGMCIETRIAVLLKECAPETEAAICSALSRYGLPTKLSEKVDTAKIFEMMSADKKNINALPRFILLQKIGAIKCSRTAYSFVANEKIIRRALTAVSP